MRNRPADGPNGGLVDPRHPAHPLRMRGVSHRRNVTSSKRSIANGGRASPLDERCATCSIAREGCPSQRVRRGNVTRGALPSNGREWELALVRHYLRSDGPFGSAPLAFVDATSEELARAVGCGAADADDVRNAFLGSFGSPLLVRDVLAGASRPTFAGGEAPGWFRYLVLSCLVAAAETGSGSDGVYRERLRALLGAETTISDLRGLPLLWGRLVAWCEARRRDGEPFRLVVLPDRGHMTQIGESVRIAFPSRSDRLRLLQLAAGRDPADFASPVSVVRFVRNRLDGLPWSEGFVAAFLDFETRYRRGERLLADHPFWLLTERTLTSVGGADEHSAAGISVRLVADLDDETLVQLSAGTPIPGLELKPDPEAGFSCTVATDAMIELVGAASRLGGAGRLRGVAAALDRGLMPFVETSWGVWTFSASPEFGPLRVLGRHGAIRPSAVSGAWQPAADGWWLSPPIAIGVYEEILIRSGRLPEPSDALRSLLIGGGVRTGSCLLGRPTFLPTVAAPGGATLALQPLRVERGELHLAADARGPTSLVADGPVAGAWRLTAREIGGRGTENEMRLSFVDRAFEHDVVGGGPTDGWENEVEVLAGSGTFGAGTIDAPAEASSKDTTRRDDLLEAVYAGGAGGWSEAELVPLLQRAAGVDGPRPWDVLRALREGGWVEPRLALRWGARRWLLRPLRLRRRDVRTALLDGSWCATTRDRFETACRRSGAALEVRSGRGPWSVPTVVVRSDDLAGLAAETGVPIVDELPIGAAPAPDCWPSAVHPLVNRIVAGVWCWERGRFLASVSEAEGRVRLERWARPRGDARDIYRISGGRGADLVLESRTAAILEAHRRAGVPLLQWAGSELVRLRKEGNLPVEIVGALRCAHLASSGPIRRETGEWTYAYPCSRSDARDLATVFGASVAGSTSGSHPAPYRLSRKLGPRGRALLNPAAALRPVI